MRARVFEWCQVLQVRVGVVTGSQSSARSVVRRLTVRVLGVVPWWTRFPGLNPRRVVWDQGNPWKTESRLTRGTHKDPRFSEI